ncbi:MAG: xanthine dehydrogenase family protein molybdopterin-binding subunit [Pseudomonadota bacterium]|nr:xanthine dehydrogenase family protein molybdopterin-binding subunit [Pseudomonadota bacterium]
MAVVKTTRRGFLKISAAAGGGLLVSFSIPAAKTAQAETGTKEDFEPNAWLRISSDDVITVRVASAEMGQGIMTGISMLIAEELDADWNTIKAEFAPASKAYYNPLMNRQATGGSTAIRGFWEVAREAGAVAREILIEAAAQEWNVLPNICRTEKGAVFHDASQRSLRYGEIASVAASLPVPTSVFLKEPDEFVLIGKSMPRLDTAEKVDGSAIFGSDIQLPGLLTAVVVRCPVIGGKAKSYNSKQAMQVKGVRKVTRITSGVAVIADHFWAAMKGRDALSIKWDEGPNADLSSKSIFTSFADALDNDAGITERQDGNIKDGLKAANKTLEAVYTAPYQAHACMEPMNATADVRVDSCNIYVGTQGQTATQQTAMQLTGLPEEKVKVHSTYLGGGFGRRSEQDFITDAVECSQAAGKPVKVIWTREDDIMHDQYRPATYNQLRGGIDASGKIIAWQHRIAGPSILSRVFPNAVKEGRDSTSTMGASDIPYAFDSAEVSYKMVNPGVPVGFWRSVGSSQNAYVTECFFDELAALAGRDPLQARLQLLEEESRHTGVLSLAAEKADWGKALPAGRARGIAVAKSFNTWAAQVAEVSIERGRVRVHRVTCAIDCGLAINPDSIRAQMESAVVYGLTACLKGEITIAGGKVEQNNFDNYPLLRIDECPEIDVHIVDSEESPSGIGEPGVPPVAPAVANAVFALTGKPVRSLPIRL